MATFPVGEKTHQAVLPQQPALESVGADTPGSRDETAHGQPATRRHTGMEHERGETGGERTTSRRRHAGPDATAPGPAENGNGDVPPHNSPYGGGTGAGRVFVLAKDGAPLMPCHPARARQLLDRSRAVVTRHAPFTIRLKDRTFADSEVQGVQIGIDPGSKFTGISVMDEKKQSNHDGSTSTVRRGLAAVELQHRGEQIHRSMRQRAGYRRRRRSKNLRHRAPRSHNRTRPKGWLAPAVRHRVDTTISTVRRLSLLAPVTGIHVESVAFDTHAMSEGRPLSAVEYRNGTLAGTEIRAYLLAKWGRACAYCGATGVSLNIDHVRSRSRGGSGRVSNLTLACVACNQAKGSLPIEAFLAHQPKRLAEILREMKKPLHDAAVMNATRRQLIGALSTLGAPVHTWSGARTQWNRNAMGLGKSHTIDALAVGHLDLECGDAIVRVPETIHIVNATGRGSYARTTPDRYGFPRLHRTRAKQHYGYATGDLVRAVMPSGKWAGTWTGRISVRASGQHSLAVHGGRFNVSYRHLRLLQRADGYAYATRVEPTLGTSREK
ncbi:RNA-guided endonuclease IscB [Streptomyces sp. NPDC050738]|uniref:RNA-guided endonuclease IscB n=1 Tax=Streptomyces sp. NPDC050738 TaxID=3154744 RepID=UPI003437C409